jgi:hypothetical protein
MKKLLFFFLVLLLAKTVSAQEEPKPRLYGIKDTSLSIGRFQDSLDHGDPTHFVTAENTVVLGYMVIFMPVSGTGFSELSDKTISNALKARLKSAVPGDRVHISHVRIFYNGHEAVILKGITYILR